MPDMKPLLEQFFQAVQDCPDRLARIAERAECSAGQIKFLKQRSRIPKIDLAERVARAIGYELVLVPREPITEKSPRRKPTKKKISVEKTRVKRTTRKNRV